MNLHHHFALLFIVVKCLSFTFTNFEFRIINGVDWDIANSPYLVAVIYSGVYDFAGSLITWQWVVTSAHCVIDRDKNLFTIIAGVTDIRYLGVTGQTRTVQFVDYPYEFTDESGTMDVGVIKVRQSFNPSRTVKTISFCETTIPECTSMRVYGWGFTTNDGNPSPTLKSTILSVFPFNECRRRYNKRKLSLTQTMICAAGCQTDICRGDSGAPAVVDGKLCAVTSHQVECNDLYYPTIFTNINGPCVQEFIEDAMSDDFESEN